jgi:hypothetical protein
MQQGENVMPHGEGEATRRLIEARRNLIEASKEYNRQFYAYRYKVSENRFPDLLPKQAWWNLYHRCCDFLDHGNEYAIADAMSEKNTEKGKRQTLQSPEKS